MPLGHAQAPDQSLKTGQFRDHVVSTAWMGALCDFRHMLALRRAGGDQWFLVLRHSPGSCAIAWPVTLRSMDGDVSVAYFVPNISQQAPTLLPIYSFADWVASLYEVKSPAWQWGGRARRPAPTSRCKR